MTSYFFLFIALFTATSCTTTEPPKPDYVLQGNEYAKDGLLKEAATSYQKALSIDSGNILAKRNLGILLVKLKDYSGAIKTLEKVTPVFTKNFDTLYFLAEAYRAKDKYDEAIFNYKKALKITPNEPRAMKALAWSYFKVRFYSAALNIALKLNKNHPTDTQASIILARTYLKLKKPSLALSVIRKAEIHADARKVAYLKSVSGDVYYEYGKVNKAIALYQEALKAQPLLAGALLGLGKCLLKKRKTKSAVNYISRAIRIRPKLSEGHLLLARIYEKRDKKKSLKFYRYFQKQASKDPEYLDKIQEVRKKISRLTKQLN